jgi:hypothetical protein
VRTSATQSLSHFPGRALKQQFIELDGGGKMDKEWDQAKARDWMAGDDLKAAMQKAGVLGAPTIHLIG